MPLRPPFHFESCLVNSHHAAGGGGGLGSWEEAANKARAPEAEVVCWGVGGKQATLVDGFSSRRQLLVRT